MFSSCYQLARRAAKSMLAGNWAVFHQDFIRSDGYLGNISILMNQQSLVGDGPPAGGVNVQCSGKVRVPTSGRCQLIPPPPPKSIPHWRPLPNLLQSAFALGPRI